MTRPLQAGMYVPGIAAMHRRHHPTQSLDGGWRQDQMHMVGHQHPRPHLDTVNLGLGAEQITIEAVVVIAEEGLRPTVAALGDVVRNVRKHCAGHACHGGRG